MLVLTLSTAILAIMPLAIYHIPEEDITWFCESGRRAIETEYTGSESHIDKLLEVKDFVTEIDDYMALRTDVICTNACPCGIEDYSRWDEQFTDFDMNQYSLSGPTTDWKSCEVAMGTDEDPALLDAKFNSLLEVLENEFECQGICTPGKFWLYGDVADGIPQDGCLLAMKQRFNKASGAACVVLFTTVVIDLLLFMCMFGMCYGEKEKMD
jgi:hypothetical protein